MVRDTIQETLATMSHAYHEIAIYLLDNYDSIGFTSVNVLCKEIGVSNASLVRFAQFLGFKGYKDFKATIQDEVKNKLNKDTQVVLNELDMLPVQNQLEKLSENEIRNLTKTLRDINAQTLTKMVRKIFASSRIFISGFGVSKNIMQIFEYALVSMQIKEVIDITGSISDYNPRLHTIRQNDCIFIMTLPPYSLEAIQVANFARERGSEVFLFTDSPACPIFPLASAVVRCENNSLLLTNSYVGMVAIVQVLINMLLLNSKENLLPGMKDVVETERRGYKFIKSQKDVFK